jgi:hypothetical protein
MTFQLIVHLFIQPGQRDAFRAYEGRALQIARRHGGELVTAFRPVGSEADTPDEIHHLRFPSEVEFENFVSDPEREELAELRKQAIRNQRVFRAEHEVSYDEFFEHLDTTVAHSFDETVLELGAEPSEWLNEPTFVLPEEAVEVHPAQGTTDIDTATQITRYPAEKRLSRLVLEWQKNRDKRVVFAHTYLLMTTNMMEALDSGEYKDSIWVRRLLERFAGYYLEALDRSEQAGYSAPPVWRVAFQVAANPSSTTVQNLLLGVNTHINHDLVLTLIDVLKDEWRDHSAAQRQARYADHTYVNQVIARTMEATQHEIIGRYSPLLDVLNKVSFNMDFVVISKLINQWREQVWNHAALYLNLTNRDQRHRLLQQVEFTALRRADIIMLKQGPFKMSGLL